MAHFAATSSTTMATAYAASIANAVKASGAIVQVSVNDFEVVLKKSEKPLIVYAKGGIFSANHKYLTSYKGFIIFCKSKNIINLPSNSEIINSKKIWIPSV